MEKLCFEKYKSRCIKFGVFLLCATGLLIFSVLAEYIAGVMAAAVCVVIFICFLAYYLYCYNFYKKKCVGMEPVEGIISNWHIYDRKSRVASVSIKIDEKEYFSPNYFNIHEAELMVGRAISYVLVEDTLLIYKILN